MDEWHSGRLLGIRRGVERLVYLPEWLDDPQGRPLSLSLPFTPGNQPQGHDRRRCFDNLLPDSEPIRRRIAQRYGARSTAPFELLASIGRDCVGAIQMLPAGETPVDLEAIDGMTLDDAAVADVLRHATATPLPGRAELEGDLSLSIAGAQEKTALLHHGNHWLRPLGSTPTTHFQAAARTCREHAGRHADVRRNEWLCSTLVAAYGLPVTVRDRPVR